MRSPQSNKYRALARKSGLCGLLSFATWILVLMNAGLWLGEKRHLAWWADVGISLLSILVIACAVIWLVAVIRTKLGR
jgi:hypothetical protein